MSFSENEDEFQFHGNLAERECIFELIRKVESRPFLFNCRDPKHGTLDVPIDAWNEVADGLKIKGKSVTGAECKKKWKTLRDHYFKLKTNLKGKSGDGASGKKTWEYFGSMDRVLSSYNEENENTQSNYPGDDSIEEQNQEDVASTCNDEQNEKDKAAAIESTPTTSTAKGRKRRIDAMDKLINEKILKVLEEPEETKDQFYHFGMFIGSKLRTTSPQIADHLMSRITKMLFETMYSVVDLTSHLQTEESTM